MEVISIIAELMNSKYVFFVGLGLDGSVSNTFFLGLLVFGFSGFLGSSPERRFQFVRV